jgi:predicted ATPase/class 3 adenylate cyclase
MRELPTGTVTFLFTDIEGSTRLFERAPDLYPVLLDAHRRLLVEAVDAADGAVFGTEGDALFAAFASAAAGIAAATAGQRAMAGHPWPEGHEIRVRMGIHTGEVARSGDDYVGLEVHRAARIAAAAHGGQVVLSQATRELAGDELPEGTELRDLGEHRLKDLSRRERLHELVIQGLRSDFPALRTLEARPNNLPLQLTSFVGRRELPEATRFLAGTRLLTLTGPGGTGKTRLALQMAAEMSDVFPDGLYFVALETIVEPGLVPAQILQALGVVPGPGEPPLERLVAHLRDRELLLVLDNFEQVLGAASVVTEVVHGAPEVKVVVTSRAPLMLYGEQVYPVSPFPVPDPAARLAAAELAEFESVRLFLERAMAARPDFALTDANAPAVAEIVARLDGLPLAIELAAARARLLSAEAIRTRLDQRLDLLAGGARDLPDRQRTIRGAIDWSYELLEPPDRRLFERFSVFSGGADLAEAEAVCGPASDLGQDVLEGLGSLVDASLLRPETTAGGEPRFVMLATIREYGQERLASSAPEATGSMRRRHAKAYLALAERCAPYLTGGQAAEWLDRIERDHDNLRAAIDWAVSVAEPEIAIRIAASIWRFWQVRGHLHEAAERWARILAMPGLETVPEALQASAFGAAGSIAYWRGEAETTYERYQSALDAARRSGDPALLAEALYNASFAPAPTWAWGELQRWLPDIRSYLDQALELYGQLADARGEASAHWALGNALLMSRQLDDGERHVREGLVRYERLDDRFGLGWARHMLALLSFVRGDLDAALSEAREAARIFSESRDRSALVLILVDFALIAQQRGQLDRGWRLAGAADALRELTGTDLASLPFDLPGWQTTLAPPEDATYLPFWEEGRGLSAEKAVAYALEMEPGSLGSAVSVEASQRMPLS